MSTQLKRSKRTLAFLLALTMVFTMVPATTAENGPTDPVITVDTVTANVGEIVQIDVLIANNPQIHAIRVAIDYDDRLELVEGAEVIDGIVRVGQYPPNWDARPFKLIMECESDDLAGRENGIFFTMQFRVLETAANSR